MIRVLLLMFMADLVGIKAQPDAEKRSEQALAHANLDLDRAREAYQSGDVTKMDAYLQELRESVDMSYHSLEASGKTPRKSRYYKQAELKTRALVRRLNTLDSEANFQDRKVIEDVRQKVQEIHDELLLKVMSK